MSSNLGQFWAPPRRSGPFTGNETAFVPIANQVQNIQSNTSGGANGVSIQTSLDPGSESWVSSAQQALANVLQASQAHNGPSPGAIASISDLDKGEHYTLAPPNSPAMSVANITTVAPLMGGQVVDTINTSNGTCFNVGPGYVYKAPASANGVINSPQGVPAYQQADTISVHGAISHAATTQVITQGAGDTFNGASCPGQSFSTGLLENIGPVATNDGVDQVYGVPGAAYASVGPPSNAGHQCINNQNNGIYHAQHFFPAEAPSDPCFSSSQALPVQSLSSSGSMVHSGVNQQVSSVQAQTGMIPASSSFHSLPQSQSFQTIPQSQSVQGLQHLMSPGPTPQHLNGNILTSPDTTGRLTEPRNYAPRTSGLPVGNMPPPKFGLETNQNPSPRTSTQSQDPFVSPQINQALVPYQTMNGGAHSGAPMGGFIPPAAPRSMVGPKSNKLMRLTNGLTSLPSVEAAMDPANFPFVDGPRQSLPQNYGVVKLKNIPFATKRSEVIAFLGRNSKILNDSEEPVHIIMERATSKTMDAYVEFNTLSDAMKAAERHHNNTMSGRVSRLGDRPVEVELSSQASLMKDLFPIARGILWDGPNPQFKPHNSREPWENFKGFISCEEMTMLVKHVEVPHRSPFSKECPQRPYECLISTLRKFPWHMTEHITIIQRQAVYKATRELVSLLMQAMKRGDDVINLSPQLFKRVVAASIGCKGFTTMMKDDIAALSNTADEIAQGFGQPLFANAWTHQYALAPKAGIPLDVIEWYISLIREQTHRDMLARPLTERTIFQEKAKDTNMH